MPQLWESQVEAFGVRSPDGCVSHVAQQSGTSSECGAVPVCQCVCVSVHGCTRCTSLAKPGADVHIVKSCSTLLSLSMYRHHTPTAITILEAEQVL